MVTRRKLSAEDAQAVRELYAEGGVTMAEIAESCGLSNFVVWNAIRSRKDDERYAGEFASEGEAYDEIAAITAAAKATFNPYLETDTEHHAVTELAGCGVDLASIRDAAFEALGGDDLVSRQFGCLRTGNEWHEPETYEDAVLPNTSPVVAARFAARRVAAAKWMADYTGDPRSRRVAEVTHV